MAVSDTSRTSMESPLVLKKTFVSRKGDLSEEEMIRRGADAKGPIVRIAINLLGPDDACGEAHRRRDLALDDVLFFDFVG